MIICPFQLNHRQGGWDGPPPGKPAPHTSVGRQNSIDIALGERLFSQGITELLDGECADLVYAHGAEIWDQMEPKMALLGDDILPAGLFFTLEIQFGSLGKRKVRLAALRKGPTPKGRLSSLSSRTALLTIFL